MMRSTDGWNWKAKEKAEMRRRGVRHKLSWRTPPNERQPYRYFDGEKVVAFRSAYDLPALAGSSLNRKNAKRKEVLPGEEKKQGSLFEALYAQSEFAQLCGIEAGLPNDPGGMAGSKKLPSYGVRLLSAKSKDRIRGKTRALFAARGKSCTFVTLTFISAVTDRQGISMLNKFLTAIRKEQGDFNYLWVAERQTKNVSFKDNIHFHIIIDRRLSVVRYNSLWLLQQYNAGLRGYSRLLQRHLTIEEVRLMHDETMLWVRRYRMAKAWGDDILSVLEEKIHAVKVGRFLNPFNIKKVRTLEGLGAYLTKYVTKNKDSFQCSVWRCSRGVSRMFTKRLVSLELWEEAGDVKKNFAINESTGELFEAKTVCPPHGFCLIRYIFNKKYFSQYTRIIDVVNDWILKGDFVPCVDRISFDEYLSRIHNAVGYN